jgi:DNA-binding NtrC family response regulator
MKYIPREDPNLLPATVQAQEKFEASEKEAIVRMLLKLKQEVDYMKDILANAGLTGNTNVPVAAISHEPQNIQTEEQDYEDVQEAPEEQELDDHQYEQLSLKSLGQELIEKVLRKHGGNRKAAAAELGISERTLYRKLKK